MNNKYTLYWLGGESQIVEGETIQDACSKAGIGGGAIHALDFYDNGDTRDKWQFSKNDRKWVKK